MPRRHATKTELGDIALLDIAMRLEDYKRLQGSGLSGEVPGRHIWSASERLRHGNAVIDTIAVVEVFTTIRLLSSVPGLSEQDVSNWQKRESAWSKHGGVAFGSFGTTWAKVFGFVEIRNALQHGMGRLTDFQLSARRRTQVLEGIRATSVSLNGDLVVLRSSDVVGCSAACTDFISKLDLAGPS